MALSDFQVGHGNYALAYGRHVALGILAGHDDSTPTAIKVKMLLGLGEWEGMTELSYDGSIIDPANYTFHPGTLSTGAADPVQGADARFPNDIYHSRIAYYTVTLPDGMGTEPDKLRAIIDCLKVNDYRIDRNNPTYDFSVNPANAFADVVRRNCVRLGLNFQDYMDWTAYDNAYDFYATQYQIDDEAHTPREVRVSNNSASGSLLTGNYYYRVTSLGANSSESAGSELKLITTSSGSTNTVSWTEDADATVGYRVYFSYNDPDNLDQYFEVASGTTTYAHSTDSGATAGIVPTLPSGDWAVTTNQFECHRAFTQDSILTGDALTAITFDAASRWVRDGKKYRILLPNETTVSHRFTADNTTEEQFRHWKVPIRQRANQIAAAFRNLSNNLKPEELTPANTPLAQTRVGIVREDINLGSMNVDQARRVARWRLKDEYIPLRRGKITGQSDSTHLLAGDIVEVDDRQAGNRNPHGNLSDSGGVIFSSLSSVSGLNGSTIRFVSSDPNPIGRSAALKVSPPSTTPLTWTAPVTTPAVVTEDSEIVTKIFISETSAKALSEISILIQTNLGNYEVKLKNPQVIPAITGANYGGGITLTNSMTIGYKPPSALWIPVTINLSSLGLSAGELINGVGGGSSGRLSEVNFSEMIFFDRTPEVYQIVEIDDKDSDSPDDRTFTLRQYNQEAYSQLDGTP